MKLHNVLGGMDSLRFDSMRRDSWLVGIDMVIDYNAQEFRKAVRPGGPYTVYRLSQDDYFATDWRGLSSVAPPDIATMNLEQLLRESDNRVSTMSIVGDRKTVIFPLVINGERMSFTFTLIGNVLTRV